MTSLFEAPLDLANGEADGALTDVWANAVQHIAGLPFVARRASDAARDLAAAAAMAGRSIGEHVHLANAYSIALGDTQPALGDIFRDVRGWMLADGRPLAWISALRGDSPRLPQVRGPQFMLDVADRGRSLGLRHYLLGGSPEVLADLQLQLQLIFPGIEIVGASSPPFRAPSAAELHERDAAIRDSGAQIVWIGLGTPKQDLEAIRLAASVPVVAVAVGAAFDYAAGSLKPAPHWISFVGLEWLWRFAAEPRRLWKRYTVGNLQFLRAVLREQAGGRGRRSHRARTAEPRATVVGQLPPPMHGSAVMTQRLIEAIGAVGSTVSVVDRRFSRSVAEVGRPGLRKLAAVPSLVLRFLSAARRSDLVVLLITTSPASFLIDRLLLSLTSRRVVLYVHTVGFRALAARGRFWDRLVRESFAHAERVVVLGPSLVADVAPFVPEDRITVVPNSTPVAPFQAHIPGHRVLFLSNLLPGKGADVFVQVAHDLVAQHPDRPWRFDLAGAGDASTLAPLPAALTVHGVVHGDRKAQLLASADVLVVPSTYAMEAQPLVIVEALSYGLPVVAFDSGGIRDLVDDTVGALVPAGDVDGLEHALVELLGSVERIADARAGALERFELQHSPQAFTGSWRRILRGVDVGGAR